MPSVRPGIEVEITREPVGVVGLITPWNFPHRDPRLEDRAGARLRQLRGVQAGRARAGLRLGAGRHPGPRGRAARRVQPGDGHAARRSATRWSTRPTSTPSASPARSRPAGCWRRQAAARMAKFQLEMGGKNPLVVLDDADLDVAVNCAVQGALLLDRPALHGQSARLIVTEGIHDRFVAAMVERLEALRIDDALAARHRDRPGRRRDASSTRTSTTWTIGARARARTLAFGGERLRRADARGFYIAPGAVHRAPRNGMRINREEIFGPVAARDPRRATTTRRWRWPTTRLRPRGRHLHHLAEACRRTSSARRRPAW